MGEVMNVIGEVDGKVCVMLDDMSPDVGGVARARAFAKKLNDAPLAIIDKRRQSHNEAEVMNVIGEVDGKVCVILRSYGAKSVIACANFPELTVLSVANLLGE